MYKTRQNKQGTIIETVLFLHILEIQGSELGKLGETQLLYVSLALRWAQKG